MSAAIKKLTLRQGATWPPYYDQVVGASGSPLAEPLVSVTATMTPVGGGAAIFTARACTITDAAARKFLYQWLAGDTDTVGEYRIEFTVTLSNGKTTKLPADRDALVAVTAALGV